MCSKTLTKIMAQNSKQNDLKRCMVEVYSISYSVKEHRVFIIAFSMLLYIPMNLSAERQDRDENGKNTFHSSLIHILPMI